MPKLNRLGSLRTLLSFPKSSVGGEGARLGVKLGLSAHTLPGVQQRQPQLWIIHSSKQVSQGQSQATSDIVLHQSPHKRPICNTPSDQLQITTEQDPVSFTHSISKARYQQTLKPAEANTTSYDQNMNSSSHAML